jgi:hypothetical protein
MKDTASDNPQFTLKQLMLTVTAIAVFLAIAAPALRSLMDDWGSPSGHVGSPLPLTLLFLVVLAGLMLALGIMAVRSSRTSIAAWSEGLSHAIGVLGIMAVLVAIVPAFEMIFKEFGLALPAMTLSLLTASNAAARYWYLVLPAMGAFVAMDVLTFRQLHASPIRRGWARAWSATITFLLLAAIVGSFAALFLPLTVIQ